MKSMIVAILAAVASAGPAYAGETRKADWVNVGSSTGLFGFDWASAGVAGLNLAACPQGTRKDFEKLKAHRGEIADGAHVIIPLCPFTSVLQPNYDETHHGRADHPLLAFDGVPNEQALKGFRDVLDQVWKREFQIKDYGDPMSSANRKSYGQMVGLMRDVVAWCRAENLKPVFVYPPAAKTFDGLFPESFVKAYVRDFVRDVTDGRVPFLDYSKSSDYRDDALFANALFLNQSGRRKFTADVIGRVREAEAGRSADGDAAPRLRQTVVSQPGEAWWGLATRYGSKQPWTADSEPFAVDLARKNLGNQAAPLLISSRGRWIWSERPFAVGFTNGVWTLTAEPGGRIEQGTADVATLRGALLDCARRFFPASGKTPDLDLIAKPQLNTWIELTYNQNQKDVLKYAHDAVANGFPPAVMMVDDTWQYDYGTWQFDPRRFADPKAMCDELHSMGFKLMLWVVPYVSMDSREYRELEKTGGLCPGRLRDDNGQMIESATVRALPEAFSWWNGQSACLDLTHPAGARWFADELSKLQRNYGVDGFKFDAGDANGYPAYLRYHDPLARAVDQSEAYARIGLRFPLNEYRACWKMAGQPLVQRLCDKGHRWSDLACLVPDMIAVGLLGHSFVCPDMVGGGEYSTFLPGKPFDPELFVRSAQIHALAPMIQFSAAPWRVLDARHLAFVREVVATRQCFAPRFVELAKECAKTGEPMLRSLEYAYPNRGYAAIRDEFLMGDFLLVAPQTAKGAATREVAVPPGTWRGDDGREIVGPARVTVETPLARLPYFERVKE